MFKELEIRYESAEGDKHHYRFSAQYMPVRVKHDPAVSFLKHQIGSELSFVPGLFEQTGLQGAGKKCFSEMPADMFVEVESAGSVEDGCFQKTLGDLSRGQRRGRVIAHILSIDHMNIS